MAGGKSHRSGAFHIVFRLVRILNPKWSGIVDILGETIGCRLIRTLEISAEAQKYNPEIVLVTHQFGGHSIILPQLQTVLSMFNGLVAFGGITTPCQSLGALV